MRTDLLLNTLMPSTRQKILTATILQPKKLWYLRELAGALHLTPSSIQRELKNLTIAGILQKKVNGNRVYFSANQECPIYLELKSILVKTVGVVGFLRNCLKPFLSRIAIAFIYGSIATGMESSESDIDLLIVGDVGLAEVAVAIRPAEQQLSRSINPIVLSKVELHEKLKKKNHFISTIWKQEKLVLWSQDNELARAFGKPQGKIA